MNEQALVTTTDTSISVDTDATIINAWLHGTPATTGRAYRREVYSMLDYTGKHLQDVTIFDLQAYENDRLTGLADTSRKRAISALRSLYAWMIRAGLTNVNPATLLRAPKINETIADRYLTPEQVTAIMAQAKTPRDRAMMELAYYAGLRVSEIVELTWADVRLLDSGAVLHIMGKGGKLRKVTIDQEMLSVLQSLFTPGKECVFASRKTGDCMTTTQAQRIIVDAGSRAGIKVSPHYFRHAHASHALEQGASIASVRDELGHANVATTNKYLHATNSAPIGSLLRKKQG